MQKRRLGKGNLEVSALGLGCMGMSFSYGPPKDKQEMISLIHAAVDAGLRSSILPRSMARSPTKNLLAHRPGAAGLNSRPEHIKEAVEGSLKWLQIETIDLYYQHRVDPNVPIEDVAGAVKNLILQG